MVIKVLESLRRTDPTLMMFVRLAATTGARRGEILGLSWGMLIWFMDGSGWCAG